VWKFCARPTRCLHSRTARRPPWLPLPRVRIARLLGDRKYTPPAGDALGASRFHWQWQQMPARLMPSRPGAPGIGDDLRVPAEAATIISLRRSAVARARDNGAIVACFDRSPRLRADDRGWRPELGCPPKHRWQSYVAPPSSKAVRDGMRQNVSASWVVAGMFGAVQGFKLISRGRCRAGSPPGSATAPGAAWGPRHHRRQPAWPAAAQTGQW